MKATRRIAVRTYWLSSPQSLGSEVIEMAPLKFEETLHDYLRRHFEKISQGNAQQFAEQNTVTRVDVPPPKSKPGTGA
jgi:hypothetical protein